MYLLALTVGLSLSYVVLLHLFFTFFKKKQALLPSRAFISIAIIAFLSIMSYVVSEAIPDRQWANRFLHAMGGGFLSYVICFLVVRDSKLDIGKFQFVVFSALVVTAMGVMNEILEYVLQNYFSDVFHFIFAKSINDTWLDLVSNSVGIVCAAVLFNPFVGKKEKNR